MERKNDVKWSMQNGKCKRKQPPSNCQLSTANHDIQHHHQNESQRKSDSADVAMFTFRCLGNQFFHHYINPNRSLGHFVALS